LRRNSWTTAITAAITQRNANVTPAADASMGIALRNLAGGHLLEAAGERQAERRNCYIWENNGLAPLRLLSKPSLVLRSGS
jgi:hypothetical protein